MKTFCLVTAFFFTAQFSQAAEKSAPLHADGQKLLDAVSKDADATELPQNGVSLVVGLPPIFFHGKECKDAALWKGEDRRSVVIRCTDPDGTTCRIEWDEKTGELTIFGTQLQTTSSRVNGDFVVEHRFRPGSSIMMGKKASAGQARWPPYNRLPITNANRSKKKLPKRLGHPRSQSSMISS